MNIPTPLARKMLTADCIDGWVLKHKEEWQRHQGRARLRALGDIKEGSVRMRWQR